MLYDKKWDQDTIKIEPWRQALLDAADLLEKDGWCRFSMRRGEAHCAVGALLDGYSPIDAKQEATRRLAIYIKGKELPGMLIAKICVRWNDGLFRTKKQVIKTLREVAKKGDA